MQREILVEPEDEVLDDVLQRLDLRRGQLRPLGLQPGKAALAAFGNAHTHAHTHVRTRPRPHSVRMRMQSQAYH